MYYDALDGQLSNLFFMIAAPEKGGVVMCAINPFVAMLNTALTNGLNSMNGSSKILLGLVLGGIFVFPVVGNWPLYLVALFAGSLVGMAVLVFLKTVWKKQK